MSRYVSIQCKQKPPANDKPHKMLLLEKCQIALCITAVAPSFTLAKKYWSVRNLMVAVKK